MSNPFRALLARSNAWFEQARRAGWLDDADLARLAAVEQATPSDLFVEPQTRPLVVAIFGGTGVGKSSLLNRLAGQPLARTGVERPTSREVTVYVHESVRLGELPPHLPLDAVRIKRHASVEQRGVLWIDAPDIDSTEEANRRCALAWLPHVDLVCYVVSPERYRDDSGWRVLRARGHKHGWLFVLNRWDEGDPQQLADFARMLGQAGFTDPLLVPTCCLPGRPLPSPDQLGRIHAALTDLLAAHGVRELTRLGHRARLQELRGALQAAVQRLGTDAVWERVTEASRAHWQVAATTIRAGMEWSIRATAAQLVAEVGGAPGTVKPGVLGALQAVAGGTRPAATGLAGAASVVSGVDGAGQAAQRDAAVKAGPASATSAAEKLDERVAALWDDWSKAKVTACLDALELVTRRTGLAPLPLRQRLDALAESAPTRVAQHLRDHLRAALARPGGALRRALRRVTGFLMSCLPLLALLWVGWNVLRGYYAAASGQAQFLGGAFAIHSVLLVLVAWLVPFTLDRALRPALERIVLRALRAGLQAGLDELGTQLDEALSQAASDAAQHRQPAAELLREVTGWLVKPIDARQPAIGRLMVAAAEGDKVKR